MAARIPGSSYELSAQRAAEAMDKLLALRGTVPPGLCPAFAQADMDARYAVLAGKEPPRVAACTRTARTWSTPARQ